MRKHIRDASEMTMDLATNVLKVAAAFHATGYHCLQEKQGGVKKFLEDVPELVFNGWLAFKAPEDKAKHDAIHIQNYLNIKVIFSNENGRGVDNMKILS